MGKKRRHEKDFAPTSFKRQKQVPNGPPRSFNIPSVNALKSKIRDLSRVLDHDEHLPAGVRIEKERALAGYKQDLDNAEEEKRKQALIKRYHMVRFFERRKATRHLQKAKTRLESSPEGTIESAQAREDVHIAEVDLNYTLYCPLNEKYEGIYPREATQGGNTVMREHGNGGEAEKALRSRPAMWKVVENAMKLGTLDALRDGKMTSSLSVCGKKPAAKKGHARGPGGGVMNDFGAGSKPSKMDEWQGRDEESDGGFFEE